MSNESRRVLVVEDDEGQSLPFRQLLEHRGFRVLVAGSGPEALEAAWESPPDLVVVDLTLMEQGGGMDGFLVIASLREDARTSAVPILVWTGRRLTGQDEIRALRLGADDVVSKSTEYGVIEARIESLLRRGCQAVFED